MTATLTVLGWVVVHALWQCTFIAGVAALLLGILRSARPEARDGVATFSLAAMAIAPFITAVLKADLLPAVTRRPVLMTIDLAVPMPTYLEWRSAAIPVIGALWLTGVIVGLARLGFAWRRADALRSAGIGAAGPSVHQEVASLCARLSVTGGVDVRRSTLARVPMVLGWMRPVILLPHQSIDALSPSELRSILAHELAHVRRRDYVANICQLVAEIATFFHPAARWMSRRIRIEREYCCDDTAIEVAGDRAIYARALAALDDARSHCPLAVAAVSGTLLDRIERIAGRPRRLLGAARGVIVMLAATITAAALLAAALALPQNVPAGAKLRSRRPPGADLVAAPNGVQLPKRQSR